MMSKFPALPLIGFVVAIILLVSVGGVYGNTEFRMQTVLAKLIQEALEQNNEIISLKSRVLSIRKMAHYAGSLSDPRLGVAFSNLPIEHMDFASDPMTQKQVFIAQKFPWPGKRGLKTKGILFEAESTGYLLRVEKLKLAGRIADSYYELGYLYENLKFNDELKSLIEKIISVAITNYSSGRGLRQDILRAELKLSKIADTRLVLQKKISLVQNRINALLNRVEYSEVPPPEVPLLFEFKSDPNALKTKVLEKNPGLAALKTAIEKKRAMTALAKKESYPDIDFKLSYGQREEDRTGRRLDDLISLSATLNIPIRKKKRQNNNLLSKKADEDAAISQYKSLLSSLCYETDSIVSEITHISLSCRLYRDRLIPQSKKLAKSALSDYEVGKTDFSSMINAGIQSLKFELKLKEYLFDLYKKRVELEELTDGPELGLSSLSR